MGAYYFAITLKFKDFSYITYYFMRIYYTLQIVMEYCGGGSVADLMSITEEPFDESQIAYVCREALKVAHTLDPLVLNK